MRMKVYQSKPRITLSPAIRDGQKYVEVEFDEDDAIRLSLSKEKGVRFEGDRAYLPEEGFDLSGFFDRHVETAYINYSALKNTQPKKNGKTSPAIPPGYAETLPDVLSKEEIKSILDATGPDIRLFCMFSLLYSAGLRISELLDLKPHDINVSRSLIRVRQGKGRKDRYTLLSKPLVRKLTEYTKLYKPQEWLFERYKGEPFTESIVSKKLKEAAKEAGITKRVYPHLLRHSFATHLIEQGTDLKIVKELLGHNQLKTTEMYVHIADTFKSSIRTPLDDILESDNEIVK